MKIEKEKFDISVSLKKFEQKPSNHEWKFIKYIKQSVDVDMLCDLIKQGFCFCHIFKSNDIVFSVKDKTIANFLSTQTVWIDLDDTFVTINEFYDFVSIKPSILYSTPSNIIGVNNRFRAVYVFDELIESNKLYNEIVDNIIKSITNDINGFILKDKTCRNASQQFAGNAKDDIIIYSNYNVYSFSDFDIDVTSINIKDDFVQKRSYIREGENNMYMHLQNAHDNKNVYVKFNDRQFINDYFNVKDYNDACNLIDKYKEKYPYYDSTPIPIVDEDIPLIQLPNNYVEIKRDWLRVKEYTRNGDDIHNCHVLKLKAGAKGKGRGNILYKNAKIRMIMTENITFEHLLFQLFCERQYYIDNSDREISNLRLFKIALSAYTTSNTINLYKNKRKYIVNPLYKSKYHPTKNEMMRLIANAKKMINDSLIIDNYDIHLSVRENMNRFNELCIPVSIRKLYLFCKEQNIPNKGYKE